MAQYIIYFNQQWVGEHTEEWFRSRGPLVKAVVEEIREAGEYIFAAGVDEVVGNALTASPEGDAVIVTTGAYSPGEQHIGGFTVIDVADVDRARHWVVKIAEACGWPQVIRQVY